MPNRATIFLLFAAAVLAIFWPIIFGGKIFGETATIKVHYPNFYSFGNFLSEKNANPLWLSSHISGFPVYLSQQGGHLQPLVILFFKIFDFIAAYHLLTILNFFLAGVLVFWFCRLIEISKAGSIIAGFSYAFSHAMMWAGSILVFGNLFPLIPLFFICILKIYENDKRRLFALLAVLALTLGWLGAFTEGVFYLLAVGFMFALFLDSSSAIAFLRVWSRSPKGETCGFPMGQTGIQSACPVASERSEDWCGEGDIPEPASLGRAKKAKRRITELLANFKATKWCIAIGIISLILASPWFLPTFSFATALSSRAGGVSQVEDGNYLVLSDFIRLAHPYFDVLYGNFIPLLTINNMSVFLYVGILPLFLGIVSFLALKKSGHKLMWFFSGLFVFTLATMFKYSPVFIALHKLPIFNMFYGYWKWIYIMIFSWAILAGFGLDALPEIKARPIFKKFINAIKYATAGIIGFLTVLNLFFIFFKERILDFAGKYFESRLYVNGNFIQPLDYYLNLILRAFNEFSYNISFLNPRFLFSMIFLTLGFGLFWYFLKNKIDFEKFKKAAVLITALNFIILWQWFYFLLPRSFAEDAPKTAVFMKEQTKEPFRLFRFLPGFSPYVSRWNLDIYDLEEMLRYDKETLGPNLNVLFGADSIAGIENFMSRRYSRISLKAGSEFVVADADKRLNNLNIPLEEKIAIFSSLQNLNLLSMLNVKYILSSFELPSSLKKVFETTATKYNIPVYIYENPNVLARVYFAKEAVYSDETSEEKLFNELLAINDFRKETLIECQEPLCLADYQISSQSSSASSQIIVEELKNGYLKLKTKTTNPGWLVYSESNLPTWEARLKPIFNFQFSIFNENTEWRPLKIYTANYIYQAVFVPAGEHEIEFKYPGALKQMRYAVKNLISQKLK